MASTSSQGSSSVFSRSRAGRQGSQEEPRTRSLAGFPALVALAELGAAGLGAGMMIRVDSRGVTIRADFIKEESAPLKLHPCGASLPARSARGSPGESPPRFAQNTLEILRGD